MKLTAVKKKQTECYTKENSRNKPDLWYHRVGRLSQSCTKSLELQMAATGGSQL